MLAQLAAEREKRRTTAATGAAPDDSQRKQERDALIERLLEERKERKGREQQPPPPRTAWETTQDRNERRLEHELRVGACAPSGRDAAAAASDAGDDAILSGLPPPHYPEEYIDGGRVVPDSDLDDAGMADFYMHDEGTALAFDGSDLALDEDVSLAEVVARADAAMAATGYAGGGRDVDDLLPSGAPVPQPWLEQTPAAAAGSGAAPAGPTPSTNDAPAAVAKATTSAAKATAAAKAAATAAPAAAPGGGGSGRQRLEPDAPPSFKPQINPRSAALASAQRGGDWASRLASQRADEFARREERRRTAEKAKMAECTFTPKLATKQASATGGSGGGGGGRSGGGGGRSGGGGGGRGRGRAGLFGGEVSERLYNDADTRAEMRERRALASEQWEVASFPFQPHVNPRPHSLSGGSGAAAAPPLYERLAAEAVKKEEKVAAIRHRLVAESDATFQPHIDPNSAAISLAVAQPYGGAGGGGGGGGLCGGSSGLGSGMGRGDIAERLTAEGAIMAERRAMQEAAVRQAEEAKCPFHPEVNSLSERIVSEGGIEGRSVLERQQQFLQQVEAKRRARERLEQHEQSKLFKPAISDASAILLEARQERLHETPLDKVDRLTYVDAQRREGVRQQLQAEHYQRHTYKPQIDAISARLARSKTDQERSSNTRGQARKSEAEKSRERELLAECTFKPKLDTRSEVLAEGSSARTALRGEAADEMSRRIEAQMQEREAKLEQARRVAQHDQLKECTFAPKLRAKSAAEPADASPVVVRGLGRYMELKEMAKRQAEAQKQREQKAFIVDPPARLQGYTVPEPFRLSEPRVDEARLRELSAHQMRECTFAPKTNEVSSTQLLARVMQREEFAA